MSKLIIILGCNGKIGRKLTLKFLSKKYSVIGIDIDVKSISKNNFYYIDNSKNSFFEQSAFMQIIKKYKLHSIIFAQRFNEKNSYKNNLLNFGDSKIIKIEIEFIQETINYLIKNNKIQNKTKILFFSSTNSETISNQSAWYHISKSGIEIFTKWLASRLLGKGIGVNCIRLGLIETNSTKGSTAEKIVFASLLNGRPTQLKTIVDFAYFIIDQANSDMTGQIYELSNGYQLKDPFHLLQK